MQLTTKTQRQVLFIGFHFPKQPPLKTGKLKNVVSIILFKRYTNGYYSSSGDQKKLMRGYKSANMLDIY